jgi:hypothetical protein
MGIEDEKILWGKYTIFVPKKNRISKKVFHAMYIDYKKHPEKRQKLLNKLKSLSKNKLSSGGKMTRKRFRRNKRNITTRR